jgi:hypothetical protein
MRNENLDPHVVISAAFCDLFMAEGAIRALTQAGFEEGDVELVGILGGRVPDLTGFCQSIGLPLHHALYYEACFEDGGALLTVRTRTRKHAALAVLTEHGGIFPPSIN